MHHGQSRGGNEIHRKYVKAGDFFKNRGEFVKVGEEIIIFAKQRGNVLKQGKQGGNSKFVVDD